MINIINKFWQKVSSLSFINVESSLGMIANSTFQIFILWIIWAELFTQGSYIDLPFCYDICENINQIKSKDKYKHEIHNFS